MKYVQIQDAQKTLNMVSIKKRIARYITVNLSKTKDKEKILKAAREKHT